MPFRARASLKTSAGVFKLSFCKKCFVPLTDLRQKAFTFIETIVVILSISILIAFVIPNYTRSIRKAQERDAIVQLTTLHAANEFYKSESGFYWSTGGTPEDDISVINSNLATSLISKDDKIFEYNSVDGSDYAATVTWGDMVVEMKESPLSSTNPCCAAEAECASLSVCE